MTRGDTPIRVRGASGGSFRSQAGPEVHRRKLWRLLACMLLAAGLGLIYVWQHIQTNLIGYHVRDVELENQRIRMEIARLENEAAQLAAPARVDRIARTELDMVRQGTWDLVLLPEPPTPPAPAGLPAAPTFWHVQEARWLRLARIVHATFGPGEAAAAQPPDTLGLPSHLQPVAGERDG